MNTRKLFVWSLALGLMLWLTACNLPSSATPPMATPLPPSPTIAATDTPTPTPQPAAPQDCQQDASCLIAAAQNCQPASGQFVSQVEIFGAQASTVTQFDIQGPDADGLCVFRVSTVEASLVYTDEAKQQLRQSGMNDEEIEAQRKMVEDEMRKNGPSGTCKGQSADLAALLQQWQSGKFTSNDWAPFSCTGGTLGQPQEVEITVEVTPAAPTETPTPAPTATPTPQPAATPTGQGSTIPQPQIEFLRVDRKANPTYDYYYLQVVNWQAYPAAWFAPAPDLPPCGLNHNASRAWVSIINSRTNTRLQGFCALSSPQALTKLWFATGKNAPPPEQVVVDIWDRKTDTHYRSAPVTPP